MSLSRALFNEFRPLFRMMEDPFAMDPSLSALRSSRQRYDPFNWQSTTPALNLSEENDHYIVEAEVPGVKKENLGLRIGDGGRSLTIEGKVVPNRRAGATTSIGSQQADSSSAPAGTSKSTAVTKTQENDNQEVSNYSGGGWDGIRTFTRTVWLPHRVDSNAVKATLDHGVLTVTAPKAKDETISINVDVVE